MPHFERTSTFKEKKMHIAAEGRLERQQGYCRPSAARAPRASVSSRVSKLLVHGRGFEVRIKMDHPPPPQIAISLTHL